MAQGKVPFPTDRGTLYVCHFTLRWELALGSKNEVVFGNFLTEKNSMDIF